MSDDFVEKWLIYLEYEAELAIASIKAYGLTLTRLDSYLSDKGFSFLSVQTNVLREFSGVEAHQQGLSHESRRPLVSAVRLFFKWFQSKGYRDDNPARHLDYPKKGKPLPTPISIEHAEKLLLSLDLSVFLDLRDAAIISLFLGTGIRVSGLVGLNERDVIVQETNGRSNMFIRVMEKGRKVRIVPVPDTARMYLHAYMGHEEFLKIDRALPDGNEVLFVSTRNHKVAAHEFYGEARRIAVRTVQQMIVKRGEAVGIPRNELHPHAFRHRFGTELSEDEVDLKRIQLLMGHANIQSTQVYLHLSTRLLVDVVDQSNPLNKIKTPMRTLSETLRDRGAR